MNKAVTIGAFLTGAAVGSVSTWYILKKKYEKIAKEEIESTKKVFKELLDKNSKEKSSEPEKDAVAIQHEKAEMAREKPSMSEYAKLLNKTGYTKYSSPEQTEVEEDEEEDDDGDPGPTKQYFGNEEDKPYVISPDEFGEFDDYTQITLFYYTDHVLAESNDDEMVEDVEGSVGFESLNHFGEYDDDSVYVRNDRLKIDYEILRSERAYSDVIKSKPYLQRSMNDER